MAEAFLDSSSAGYQHRARRLIFVVVLTFVSLTLRLAYLQFVEGAELHATSVRNFIRTVRLPADRGTIYDRNGKVLATNRPSFDLYVTPAYVSDIEALLDGLEDVLDSDALDRMQLQERVEQPRGMWRFRAIRVSKDIDRKRVALAEGLRARVDGISIRTRYQREYPMGEVGAHLVGYLGRPRARELENDRENRYSVNSMIGRFGLERRYEDVLAGYDGFERYAVNALGTRKDDGWAERAMEGQVRRQNPTRGQDVYLTVDAEVQKILIEAMARYESGAAVVLDPRNGSILGIVSKPGFDPNQWSGRLTRSIKQTIDDNPYKPMLDKSVHSYFPGSIYKVVTALAALEEGVIDPYDRVDSPGSYEFGNHTFRCHKRSGHGKVDLDDAMAASADVYFYKLGEALGIDTLAEYGRRFGFGERTALRINGESRGIVPTKAYHNKRSKGGYQAGLALSTAIGQGDMRTTPLQMAIAYSALANGGTVYAARIVDRIKGEDGELISKVEPDAIRTLEADPDNIAAVNHALERAVNDPDRGTGKRGAVDGGDVAGKTGTAQVKNIIRGYMRQTVNSFRDRDHAWFAAYAPYESPRITVVVFLEHGGSGGRDAAPVSRYIMESYHQRIEPIFNTTASAETSKRRRHQRVR